MTWRHPLHPITGSCQLLFLIVCCSNPHSLAHCQSEHRPLWLGGTHWCGSRLGPASWRAGCWGHDAAAMWPSVRQPIPAPLALCGLIQNRQSGYLTATDSESAWFPFVTLLIHAGIRHLSVADVVHLFISLDDDYHCYCCIFLFTIIIIITIFFCWSSLAPHCHLALCITHWWEWCVFPVGGLENDRVYKPPQLNAWEVSECMIIMFIFPYIISFAVWIFITPVHKDPFLYRSKCQCCLNE